MFERFTDPARRVVVLAQEEARLLNHPYIGSEHTLLGLLAEGQGIAAQTLWSFDVSIDLARAKVVALVGRGERPPASHIPFTPQAKRALEGALREAMQFGDHAIGTEHLLLGLIREGDSTAARALVELGLDLDAIRNRVVELRSGGESPDPSAAVVSASRPRVVSAGTPVGILGSARLCSFCGRDLWEVERYVMGSSAVICDVCLESAHDVVAHAPGDERALRLPPRVFGDAPDATSVDAIVTAVGAVFSLDSDDVARALALEDGERLAPLHAEARHRVPGADVEMRVDRIRFAGRDAADVRFTASLGGAPGPSFEGNVVRLGGRWKVSREFFCSVMRTAGVECPPPEAG